MAKQKKGTRKKKSRKKSRQKKIFKNSLLKALAGIACVLVIVVMAGVIAHVFIKPEKHTRPQSKSGGPLPVPKKPIAKIPQYEVYPNEQIPPKKEISPKKKPLKKPPTEKKRLPQVAIIIDDLGYDKKIAKDLSNLSTEITFSILPYSPFQKNIVKLSRDRGIETMLHLPMEPIEYPKVDPGPGSLLTSMTPDQLIRQLNKNLNAVPDIKGVNNHMGSKMTQESSQMYQIFSVLKKKQLYFVDSRTSPQTLCKPSARLFQIPFAQRDIFLDHEQEARFIRRQIKELIRIALRNGYAIGIGHPYTITYKVLREMLPDMQKEVELVPASKIVHLLG